MTKAKVLFVCTENRARSQIAAGLLKHRAGQYFDVDSCGTKPGDRVHPLAVKVLQDVGIDISEQKPKGFINLDVSEFDYIFSVCESSVEACPVIVSEMGAYANWRIPDPASLIEAEVTPEQQVEIFKKTMLSLSQRIDKFVLAFESRNWRKLRKEEKTTELQKIHEELLDREHCSLYKMVLRSVVVDTQGILCVTKDKATIIVNKRFAEMKEIDVWSVSALFLSLLTTLSTTEFKNVTLTRNVEIGVSHWKFLFLLGLILSGIWTLHRLVNRIKNRGPDRIKDLILQDLDDVSTSYRN